MDRASFGGFVLAGGLSSRMGTDKALLELEGKCLLVRAAETVRAAVGSVAIVAPQSRYTRFGYDVLEDQFASCGPLAGIAAALQYSLSDWNLIVACDMPGLSVADLQQLLRIAQANPDADVVLARSGGRPQPLCSVYHRRALPTIEAALHAGNRKILLAIEPLRILHFDVCEPELFRNVNTREDWAELLTRDLRQSTHHD